MHLQLRRIAVGAVVSTALVGAPPAFGQTSAQEGYSAPAGSVQQQLRSPRDDSARGSTHESAVRGVAQGGLPFTGLDIAFVLATSGVLLVVGASIRRLSSR
jgi:hypothetical protein